MALAPPPKKLLKFDLQELPRPGQKARSSEGMRYILYRSWDFLFSQICALVGTAYTPSSPNKSLFYSSTT